MGATTLSHHSGPYCRRLGTKAILLFIILLQSVILAQQCEKSLTAVCPVPAVYVCSNPVMLGSLRLLA